MIIFTSIINLIEAFIFPYFLSSYFFLEQKKKFVIVSGSIQFLLLSICTYLQKSDYILTILILLINIISIFILKKEISFSYIFITLLYNFFILGTSYMGLYGTYILSSLFSLSIDKNVLIIIAASLAKIILLYITVIIIKFKVNLHFDLNILNWKSLLFFQFLLVLTFVIVGYNMVIGKVNNDSLIFLSLILFVSNLYFIFIVNKINNLYKEKIYYEKESQKEKYNREKIAIIKDIKNDIDAIDHRMFYVILRIEQLLESNEIDSIKQLVKEYKKIVLKHKMIINTKNIVFDCILSLKINELIMNNVTVKTCIFISKNEYYNDLQFIHFLIDILSHIKKSSLIDIDLREISGFLKIQMIFDNHTYDTFTLEKEINEMTLNFQKLIRLVNLDEKLTELSVVLKLEEQ